MKITATLSILTAVLLVTPCRAQVITNLTQDAGVRAAGTYSYYARGSTTSSSTTPGGGVSPFSSLFYTQDSKDGTLTWNGLYGASSNASSIGFTSGYLTDASTSTRVSGIQNVNQWTSNIAASDQQTGTSDIVFDLGSVFTITSVVITYTDATSHRWTLTTDGQSVFTSLTLPTGDSDLTLFGNQTAIANSTNGLMTFTPAAARDARYIDLRLLNNVTKSGQPSISSYGGYISEVAIFGYAAVPEPSSAGLLLGAIGLSLLSYKLRRKRV